MPIIAQWIRINPTRWKDRISLRVELYGCDYVAENLSFNGTSLVSLDLLRDPIAASRETIQFRFKTSNANGILMYSRGTQGDYLALQLRENRMILNINLGKFNFLFKRHYINPFLFCRFIGNDIPFRWKFIRR